MGNYVDGSHHLVNGDFLKVTDKILKMFESIKRQMERMKFS